MPIKFNLIDFKKSMKTSFYLLYRFNGRILYPLIACISILSGFEMSAQTTFIGRIGINYPSSPYAEKFLGPYLAIYAPTYQVRPSISGLVEQKMSNIFSITSGLEYVETEVTVGSYADLRTVNLKYLEVPLLAQINFDISTTDFQWFVFAGPQIRYNISSIVGITTSIVRKFDIGLEGGLGIAYSVSPQIQFFIDGRYVLGLLDIANNVDDYPAYTRDMRLGCGVKMLINN